MNEETMTPATSGMTVSQGMKDDLLTTAKWMKFLCIIGCIGAAIMVIIGIAMIALGSTIGGLAGSVGSTVGGAFLGVLYLAMSALYIYPIIKGFQFASATKAACLSDNEAQLARGFASLSAMVKFFGILTIVILVFYVLALLGAGALFAGMSMVK